MVESKESYMVRAESVPELSQVLNFNMARIADRLDALEGHRDRPTFYQNPKLQAAEALGTLVTDSDKIIDTRFTDPPSSDAKDHGVVDAEERTLKNIVDDIGTSKKATITLTHTGDGNTTLYTLATSLTIPSNISLVIENGAIIDGAGTLTINGPFNAGLYQCFGSSVTIAFGSGAVQEVYPEWWGAVGDGSTDDTTALQSAINSFSIIFLLPKVYIYSTLSITTANSKLTATNFGGSLKQKASLGAGVHGLVVDGADGFIVKNIVLDGNKANQTQELRQLKVVGSTDGGLIDNIIIKDSLGEGLDIQGSSKNIDVLNSRFTECKTGVWTATATITGLNFTNCKCDNNSVDGMLIINVEGANIVDCTFHNNGEDGFSSALNAKNVQLVNCISHSNGHDGFDSAGTAGWKLTNCIAHNNAYHGFNPSTGTYDVDIVGCSAYSNTYSGIASVVGDVRIIGGKYYSNTVHGIDINNSNHVAIEGATCFLNGRDGIVCHNTCAHLRLIGNDCYNNSQDGTYNGISLSGVTNSVIKGNICVDTQGTETQDYGIEETSTSDYNVYIGNSLRGNKTGAYALVGVNNIVENNITDESVDVASAATITLPFNGDYFNITGTTNITSVTASRARRKVSLKFAGILTFTDGNNLKIEGNLVTTADDTISLVCDGTNWYETGRSVN